MVNHRISSPEDFAKLAEETERLVQHVEDIRLRMAAAAKKRQSRPDFDVPSADPSHASHHSPSHDPAAYSDASSSSSSSSTMAKWPSSGVYPVMRDRDAGRYCIVEERGSRANDDHPELPSASRRKIPA